MSEKPVVADNKPKKVELKEKTDYFFCACGKSSGQPFCDGSHKGSSFSPIKFTAEDSGDAYLCMCKQSKNLPYCDGSHKSVSADEIVKAKPSDKLPDAEPTPEEPNVRMIHELAKFGLSKSGHHGEMGAMGVPGKDLPLWNDIQFITAQMARKPLGDDAQVGTEVIIGKNSKKPLTLNIPIFVSDMSFGALSEEAKISLARGAEGAGTGICSGEGGMLPEEQAENTRYFYELASAKFGYSEDLLSRVQAFHFKGGQGAKTGTGGHLPGNKVKGKISEVRGIPEGHDAISPPTFTDLVTEKDFRAFGDRVRTVTGGIPIGFKLSAQHIEEDIEFAVNAGADYIILDGRGGGTGAAPLIFRDHISVPTIPALARARRYLDQNSYDHVSLMITGGLRTPSDFAKALAMGADAIGISNGAMQAIGCVAARMCHTNFCPAGIATQKPELRKRLIISEASERLTRYLNATVDLMCLLSRACGHNHLNQFSVSDLTTWKREMSDLSGVRFSGVGSNH